MALKNQPKNTRKLNYLHATPPFNRARVVSWVGHAHCCRRSRVIRPYIVVALARAVQLRILHKVLRGDGLVKQAEQQDREEGEDDVPQRVGELVPRHLGGSDDDSKANKDAVRQCPAQLPKTI